MIRKGSTKYRRFTRFIWRLDNPVFIMNPAYAELKDIKNPIEVRGRHMPVSYDILCPMGDGYILQNQ